MSHFTKVFTLCVLLASGPVVSLLLSETVRAQNAPRITGTYSNMYFNQEGGDLLGDEVRIVAASGGYQGALQFAEGEPGDLIVVPVTVTGNRISFAIPDSSAYPGRFDGAIENGHLKGEFRFKNGGSEKVELPRGKSYWD
jgi:hypothetical protein